MRTVLLSNEKKIYRTVNAALLACMGLFGVGRFFGIAELSWSHVLAAAAVFGVFAGMCLLSGRGRALCLWILFICLLAAVAVCGVRESLNFVRFYFAWLTGNADALNAGMLNAGTLNAGAVNSSAGIAGAGLAGAGEAWAQVCELVQAGWIVALSFLLQMLLERFSTAKIWFAGGLLTAMVCCLLGRIQIARSGVAFLLCYIAMVYAEWTEGRWEKAKSGNTQRYMFWITPFLLLYFVLLLCMPVSEKPYEWRWVKEICSRVEESFRHITQNIYWGGREGFDMSLSGFSGKGELGGDLRESAREVMTIRGQRGFAGNVYLTGMTYDSFDGRQWRREGRSDAEEFWLDTAETLCAVRSYNRAYERDYRMESRLKIRYAYFNSGYVFAPLKAWEIESPGKNFEFTWEGGTLLLGGHRGYGTEYEVRYFRLNTGQREFDRFLEAAPETDGAVLEEILREYGRRDAAAVTPESMEEYRRKIYDRFLGEAELSEEASGYLAEITEGTRTDVEKLRAIERELASFTYTKTPGDLPGRVGNGSEFLDYFLLESRQGYCTYFATAFVLLARAEGIPARYVQGYCVPIEGEKEVCVYSNMAHAWPEAYIAGAGWIPFEPTPGYAQMRYHPWELRQTVTGTAGEGSLFEEGFGENPDMSGAAEGSEGAGGYGTEQPEISETGEGRKFPWRLLGTAVAVILAGCAGILAADNLLGRYRCRRMSAEERFRLEVARNLRILFWFGLERGERETLQELRERAELVPELTGRTAGPDAELTGAAAGQVEPDTGPGPLKFIENYEKMIYGEKAAGEREIRAAREDRRLLLEAMRRRDRRRYVICRLRLYLLRYR